MLDARLDKTLGGFRLSAALSVEAGATMVLVGESGSGKTTALRLLAGLMAPDAGSIRLDGDVWFDAERGTNLAAWSRSVGWVPQDYALFPHLSVAGNVGFGLRAAGVSAAKVHDRVGRTLARLGIADLAARRPHQLSGGQQQRVALARALVLEPRLLLLDEPLAALDLQTRRTVRGELKALLTQLPCVTVFVTHSPVEALVFGDRIAVLENGQLTQEGAAEDLLHRPRSPYVAELMGLNLFRGVVASREGGMARVDIAGGMLTVVDPGGDGDVFLVVNPREVILSREAPTGSAQNVLRGAIREMVPEPPLGERVRVVLDSKPAIVAEVTAQAAMTLGLQPGLVVVASFKATGVATYR